MKIRMGNRKSIMGIFLIIFAIIYCGLCAVLQDISVFYGISFLVYEVLGVFSIGFSIVHILKIKTENSIKLFGFSYALGYGANILLYILSFFVLGNIGFRIFFLVVILGSIIFNIYVIRKQRYFFNNSQNTYVVLIFYLVILCFQFFAFALNNCSTYYLGESSYYVDLLHWASDAVTFTKQFPPINFRGISDNTYYYHYFSAIQVAVSSMMTGIPVMNFVMGFSFMQSACLLVFSTYIFFDEIITNRFFVYAAMVLALFSTGSDFYSWVTPVSHMYIAPFGYDVGIASGMLTVTMFIKQVKEKKLNRMYFILTMLFFFLCAGIKGPVASIVLVILGSGCVYLLFSRDKGGRISAFVYGITLLVVFIIVFILFTNGLFSGASKTEQFLSEGTGNTILMQPQVLAIRDIFIAQFSFVGGQILFLIYYVILVNPAIFICVLLGGIVHVCEKFEVTDVILSIGVIAGILLTRTLKLIGFSQIYFIMATFPYAVGFGIRGFENIYESRLKRNNEKIRLIGIKVITIFLGILGVGLFVNSMYFRPQMTSGYRKALYAMGMSEAKDYFLDGTGGIVECTELNDTARKDYHYIVINDGERKAAEWIRDHTEKDCIITSNLINSSVYGYNYVIGIIAERWIWLEGEELVYRAVNGDYEAANQLKETGIQYLLLEKSGEDWNDKLKTVYSNESVFIVDIEDIM